MKNFVKTILALCVVLTMLCTMVTGFATTINTLEITTVEIMTDTETVAVTYDLTDGEEDTITLTDAQLMRVTAQVTLTDGGTPVNNADVSFLSYIDPDGEELSLSDENVQFIKQAVTGAEGTVEFMFRPRATIDYEDVVFVAKSGAAAAEPDSFNYTVTTSAKNMLVSGGRAFYDGQEEAVTFTTNVPSTGDIASVKIGGAALVPETDYTVDKTGENIAVTILQTKVAALAVGTHTVTISAAGYNDGTDTIVINEAEYDVPDENEDQAREGLKEALDTKFGNITPVGDSFTISGLNDVTVTVGEETKNVSFSLVADSFTDGVEIDVNGNLTYTHGAGKPFVGKAKIEAKVGTNVTVVKDIYFIPENTKIAFGNVTALDNNLADAFVPTGANDTEKNDAFKAWVDENSAAIGNAKKLALAVAAGRADQDTIAQATQTLSFNGDDVISLNEHNIYRKMLEGFIGYDIVTVNNQRALLYPDAVQ